MKKHSSLLSFPVLLLLPALLGLALSQPPAAPTDAPAPAPAAQAVVPATANAPHLSQARPGYAWVLETADAELYTGAGSSLALDAQGNPHIAYQQNYLCDLRYAQFDGSPGSPRRSMLLA